MVAWIRLRPSHDPLCVTVGDLGEATRGLKGEEAMRSFLRRHLSHVVLVASAAALVAVPSALGSHVTDGVDVKVTQDNSNVDGGTPNPSFDARNRQSN